jgi:hypothetical protein
MHFVLIGKSFRCEIFDLLDFFYFYVTLTPRVGDLGHY